MKNLITSVFTKFIVDELLGSSINESSGSSSESSNNNDNKRRKTQILSKNTIADQKMYLQIPMND